MTVSDQSPRLAALLSSASVEISSRGHQIGELRDRFAEVQEWVSSEGLTLDLQKTEVLLFRP